MIIFQLLLKYEWINGSNVNLCVWPLYSTKQELPVNVWILTFSIFVISDYKTYLKDSIIQLLGLVPHSYAIFSYRNNTPFIVSQDLTRSNSIERKSNIQDSINWCGGGKFLDKRVPALTLREEQRLITVQIKSSERCVSSKLFFTLISCLQVLFSFVFRKFLLQITKGKKRLGFFHCLKDFHSLWVEIHFYPINVVYCHLSFFCEFEFFQLYYYYYY